MSRLIKTAKMAKLLGHWSKYKIKKTRRAKNKQSKQEIHINKIDQLNTKIYYYTYLNIPVSYDQIYIHKCG